MGGGGHHHGGHHGGGRFGGGGGAYFAPPSFYGGSYYNPYWDEPRYVPVFIVEDEEDRKAKEKAKAKAAQSGLGIFASHGARSMRGLGVVFGNSTSDPVVLEAQKWLNTVLKASGYLAIGQDGKLGAETCGAVAWLMQGGASDYDKGIYFDLNTAPQSVFQVWNVCSSSSQTPPTPVTAAAKTSGYQKAVTTLTTAAVNPEAVRSAQTALNAALAAAGMCAIGVDGDAGPETCGAQTWLIANAGSDGLTQAQRDAISKKCSASARTAPAACPVAKPIVVPVQSPIDTAPQVPVPAAKAPLSTASMVLGVGLAGAAITVVYLYFKNKSGG
jgi:hypothetical protein